MPTQATSSTGHERAFPSPSHHHTFSYTYTPSSAGHASSSFEQSLRSLTPLRRPPDDPPAYYPNPAANPMGLGSTYPRIARRPPVLFSPSESDLELNAGTASPSPAGPSVAFAAPPVRGGHETPTSVFTRKIRKWASASSLSLSLHRTSEARDYSPTDATSMTAYSISDQTRCVALLYRAVPLKLTYLL